MGTPVTAITRLEGGQGRIDAVELVKLAEIIGFDAATMLRRPLKDRRRLR
jgi:hypothetical protein